MKRYSDASTNCTLLHHSLAVEPWEALPGGVAIRDWGDCVDAEPQPLLLFRDRDEVSALVRSLWRALADSERSEAVK